MSRWVVGIWLRMLGYRATWHHADRLPAGRHTLVSNHTMPCDLMVLFEGVQQRYTHLMTSGMPAKITAARNLPLVLRPATPDVYEQLAAEAAQEAAAALAAASASAAPGGDGSSGSSSGEASSFASAIHVHAEGGLTNGRYAMMQFARGELGFLMPQSVPKIGHLRVTIICLLELH